MKVIVSRTELASALTWALKGVSRRPVVPVLGGIMLSVDGDTLTLSAYDYETAAQATVDGRSGEAGVMLVEAARLKKILTAFPKDRRLEVRLVTEHGRLCVSCGGASYTLDAMPDSEYPALPDVSEFACVIAGDVFRASVKRAVVAAGTDDTLPALTCVHFTPHASGYELAATDRYRLAVDVMHAEGTPDGGSEFNIRAKVLSDYAKAAKGEKVTMYRDSEAANRIMFTDGTRTLITSTLIGEFPRVHALFRAGSPITLTADAMALRDAVRLLAPACGKNEPVELAITGTTIALTAYSDGKPAATGTAFGTLAGEAAFTVRFSPQYLASMLAVHAGMVTLGFVSNIRPVTITGDVPGYVQLLVPVKPAE